jgi:hypothetical protein
MVASENFKAGRNTRIEKLLEFCRRELSELQRGIAGLVGRPICL